MFGKNRLKLLLEKKPLAQTIDDEISNIIEKQYKRALNILKKNSDKLTILAEYLLEKEVIFKDDLERIFGKRPFADKEDAEKANETSKTEKETETEVKSK